MSNAVQTIITIASLIAAVVAIAGYYTKILKWIMRQKDQDEAIKAIKAEQQIQTRAILACLQGLAEKGCDGPVKRGIEEISDYLNKLAHR